MKNRLAIFAACLLVSACQTPQEIEAARQAQAQADTATCQSYGLRPGSEAFGNCRLQLDLARQQRYNSYYYDPYPYGLQMGYTHYHYR